MRQKFSWIALLAAGSLLIAACGGAEPTAVPPTATVAPAPEAANAGAEQQNGDAIEVLMNDIWYGDDWNNIENPPTWTVKGGSQVSLQLQNKGALEHNWAIVKAGEEVPTPFNNTENSSILLWDAGIVKGGIENMATFTAPEPGTYTVICTVAGHYPNMQGKLVVAP